MNRASLVLTCCLLAVSGRAYSDTIVYEYVDQDTWAWEEQPADPQDGQGELRVGEYTAGYQNWAYLKFNFDDVTLPVGAMVTRARLWLYCGEAVGDSFNATRAYCVDEADWNETSLAWNNKPGHASGYGSKDIASTGWHYILVTAIVGSWLDGSQSNFGFCVHMHPNGLGLLKFDDKAGNRPYLEIQYQMTKPDLYVSYGPNAPSHCNAGETIDVTWIVRNQGQAPVSDTLVVNAYLSPDSEITGDGNDIFLQTWETVDELEAGGSFVCMGCPVTIPEAPPLPTGVLAYYIGLFVDPANDIDEDAEFNNTASASVSIEGRADLSVPNVSAVQAEVSAGDTLSITYSINNSGYGHAGGFENRAVLSTNATIGDGDDVDFDPPLTFSVSSLEAGNDTSSTCYGTMPVVPSGDYYVGLIADTGDGIVEISEDNNAGRTQGTIHVQGPPLIELTLAGIYSGGTPRAAFSPGEEVTVSLQAENTDTAADTICSLEVFDSTYSWPNTVPSKIYDSHAAAADQVAHLGVNETHIYTFTFMLPADAPLGDCRILGAVREQPWGDVLDTTGPNIAEEDWSDAAHIVSFAVRSFGTTIITHGYEPSGTLPAWTLTMAQAIRLRAGLGRVLVYDRDTGVFELEQPSDDAGEAVLVFDWAAESNKEYHGYSEAAGDALFAALMMGGQSASFSLDHLHFIGHGRGSVVNSEAVERLLASGVSVEQVSTLDPVDAGWSAVADDYDVNPTLGNVGFVTWSDVDWADNYFSYDDDGEAIVLSGRPLDGAYDVNLTGRGDATGINHTEVHAWYHGTVDLEAADDGSGADILEDWYGGLYYRSRDEDGYNQSRIVNEPRGAASGSPTPIAFSFERDGAVNGDFERGPMLAPLVPFPGWSGHGGGGDGNLFENGYLDLNDGHTWRRHNRFYVPGEAVSIRFQYWVTDATESGDTLVVYLDEPDAAGPTDVIGSTGLDETSPTWTDQAFQIPANKRGTVQTLTFAIAHGAGVTSQVRVDNVLLSTSANPPTIHDQPGDVTVLEGESATFSIGASGTGTLHYQWKKNGQPVGSDSPTLVLSSVAGSDDGAQITCQVTDDFGTVTSDTATLTVHTAPIIIEQPEDATVCEAGSVTFSVVAEGAPTPACQWREDGESIIGADDCTYLVDPVLSSHAGVYDVVVTNDHGFVVSEPATLTVNPGQPTIDQQPASVAVCEGNDAVFMIAASGTGVLHYQWFRDGSPEGGDGDTLTLTDVQPGDDGAKITCEVSDECGTTTSAAATLTVNANSVVTITADPGETVCEGTTVALDAGAGFASYLWSTGEETQTIEVTSAGTYNVTVTDANGCEGTDDIYITVNANPAVTITADPGETVCEGTTVTLDAGAGFTSYLWSTGEETQTIEVTITGTYSVTVTDANACEGTDEIDITVNANPVVTITADPGETVCEGTTVTLDAGAGFTSYLWSTGETTRTIAVTTTGTYSVTATDANGCEGT
ncbi:MAG: DNRLRE domain-containing protein, partial [Phycisphaerae bacterium]|nr:DNRLRE domain-containing protein [Phycisphaerae bacterium]